MTTLEYPHTIRGMRRTTDPRRPIVECSCGERASGAPGAGWDVQDNGDGTASVTGPLNASSFNWPGHFHLIATRVPWLN